MAPPVLPGLPGHEGRRGGRRVQPRAPLRVRALRRVDVRPHALPRLQPARLSLGGNGLRRLPVAHCARSRSTRRSSTSNAFRCCSWRSTRTSAYDMASTRPRRRWRRSPAGSRPGIYGRHGDRRCRRRGGGRPHRRPSRVPHRLRDAALLLGSLSPRRELRRFTLVSLGGGRDGGVGLHPLGRRPLDLRSPTARARRARAAQPRAARLSSSPSTQRRTPTARIPRRSATLVGWLTLILGITGARRRRPGGRIGNSGDPDGRGPVASALEPRGAGPRRPAARSSLGGPPFDSGDSLEVAVRRSARLPRALRVGAS